MLTDALALAKQLGEKLHAQKLLLVTAESCTGGQLAAAVTTVPGSSHWFERGFITYSNLAKQEMLGVGAEVITHFGAVSKETAEAMAIGALRNSSADLSIAITGIAGPDGGSAKKPVGMVWFAIATGYQKVFSFQENFHGDRLEIQRQAVVAALMKLITFSYVREEG